MKAFELVAPTTIADACRALDSDERAAHPLAGGQDLLGQMKDYLVPVDRVVNLKSIPGLAAISFDSRAGLKIGALVTLTEIEQHPGIRAHFPALAEAAGSVGSPQIRNAGTIGGNLCQRPRCWYFRNEHIQCLKKGGSECYSAPDEAQNKYHAIIAGGPCHIVHPSDVAPALIALGASVTFAGPDAPAATVPAAEFFTLPTEGSILRENILKPNQIVTAIEVPVTARASRSVYIKLREKESFDWALSSVALALDTTPAGIVRDARIVLGGAAPIPWRAKAAEAALVGRPLTSHSVEAAAIASTQGAEPMSRNAYKIELTQQIIRRACRAVEAGPRSARRFTGGGDEWAE